MLLNACSTSTCTIFVGVRLEKLNYMYMYMNCLPQPKYTANVYCVRICRVELMTQHFHGCRADAEAAPVVVQLREAVTEPKQ